MSSSFRKPVLVVSLYSSSLSGRATLLYVHTGTTSNLLGGKTYNSKHYLYWHNSVYSSNHAGRCTSRLSRCYLCNWGVSQQGSAKLCRQNNTPIPQTVYHLFSMLIPHHLIDTRVDWIHESLRLCYNWIDKNCCCSKQNDDRHVFVDKVKTVRTLFKFQINICKISLQAAAVHLIFLAPK